MKSIKSLSQKLSKWYLENRRDLPWRAHKNPYLIWISEVMLQQTTVQAVIPYYERFIAKFPTVETLATAPLEDVYESWAGLGYYSRARNLHKSAQTIAANGFPHSASELIQLPGFGPYTANAVASLAYGEKIGVLDGNVIRVLSRVLGLHLEWWKTSDRRHLQDHSNALAQWGDSSAINQGLMELGATVCTPQSPTCQLCPWSNDCVAYDKNLTAVLPLKKPRKQSEVWVWQAHLLHKKGKYAVIENNYAPFLKGQLIFPGTIKKQAKKPKSFDLQHGITHHSIFIQIASDLNINAEADQSSRGVKWLSAAELKKINPSSLLQKIIQHGVELS